MGRQKAYSAYKNVFDRDGHDNDNGDIDIYQHHFFDPQVISMFPSI
jgi:hypothetical protein